MLNSVFSGRAVPGGDESSLTTFKESSNMIKVTENKINIKLHVIQCLNNPETEPDSVEKLSLTRGILLTGVILLIGTESSEHLYIIFI